MWEVPLWAKWRGVVLRGGLPSDRVRGPGVRARSVLSHLQDWWVDPTSFSDTLLQYDQSPSGGCWVAPLEQPRVKCSCSRAPRQEFWGQGSTTFILLTHSTRRAAVRCLQPHAKSGYILEVMRSSAKSQQNVLNQFLFTLVSFSVLISHNYSSSSDGVCSVCYKSVSAGWCADFAFFTARVVSLSSCWFESRGPSATQSRLSEVVSDDSRQHVLDYVPLFSWCDSNATWQCQQHCFLQQKEWWLAICISDLES